MTYLGTQSVFRELEPHEIDLVSGGYDDGETITVYGYELYAGPDYDPAAANNGNADPLAGQTDYGSGGVIADNTPGVQTFTHTQNCSSASGAAVQVANHVMGLAGFTQLHAADGSTYNGTTSAVGLNGIEFSALIVYESGTGTYGAWLDEIWTRDNDGGTFMPTAYPAHAVGYWHVHPDRGDSYTDAHDAYPSPADWDELRDMYNAVSWENPNLDPSLWLTDPNGVTREFKLSERAYFDSLSLAQMGAMTGLAGKERSTSCGG